MVLFAEPLMPIVWTYGDTYTWFHTQRGSRPFTYVFCHLYMIHFLDSSLHATPAELLATRIQPDPLFLLTFSSIGSVFPSIQSWIKGNILLQIIFFQQNVASQALTSNTVYCVCCVFWCKFMCLTIDGLCVAVDSAPWFMLLIFHYLTFIGTKHKMTSDTNLSINQWKKDCFTNDKKTREKRNFHFISFFLWKYDRWIM